MTVGFFDALTIKRSSYVNFKLVMYNMNGTLIGTTELHSRLSQCPMQYEDILNQNKFGTMTLSKCKLLLNDLLGPLTLPEAANTFFEMFLEDGRGNFIDVPVLVRNFIDKDGKQPNQGFTISDEWRLTRRFFIYDTISGIKEENSYLNGQGVPDYVRWADTINIKVEMDMSSPEQIFRPYLLISYKEIDSNIINPSNTTDVTYSMEYFSDYTSKMSQITIAFICMNILTAIFVLIKVCFYNQRNPRSILGSDAAKMYIFKFLLYSFDTWSELMFWLIFFSCSNIFIAYKL